MRISFSRLLAIILFLSSVSLLSSTIEEAKRNYDLGYYLISEYIYSNLIELGDTNEKVLLGLSLSLINQAKYHEIIELSKQHSCSNITYNRNIAYAYFMSSNFQTSYYYYDKALEQDSESLLDISGRGWSAYYLGKYSLAYDDFKFIYNSEDKNSSSTGLTFLTDNWLNHYTEIFTVFSKNSTNLNLTYGFHLPTFSVGLSYNHNDGKVSDRDMFILYSSLKSGKFTYDFSSMNAKGDYTKLYDGYGLALKSSYLMLGKDFQTTISLIGGYTYFESVSSQQVRADIRLSNQRFGISSGLSYLYLDYITPDFDAYELLYHGSFSYNINPALNINYRFTLGKRNFAYNEFLIPHDDFDIEKLMQSAILSYNLKRYTLYLKYINKDMSDNSIGIGVSYVF